MAKTAESNPTSRSTDRRKLIAVLYADMVGYSRLIGMDDVGTLQRLRALRTNLIEPVIEEHGGKIAQTGGDSLLIVFDSIDGAMRCALKMQQQLPIFDSDQPPDQSIRFRIGINIGDAIADGTDLHGDSVNVAARLQAECPPGGVCVSRSVRDHVHGRLNLAFEALGPLHLKNIAQPVEAFVVRLDALQLPPGDASLREDRPSAEHAPTHRNNLPRLAHALIGRERDVVEIEALLSRYRLVTLVGAAGAGKTSLSLQVGADMLAHFPGGVWFVELAPLDRAELVDEAVAAVFGLPMQGERPATDAIAAFLQFRRTLLILDNCEHVIAAAANLANALLKTCPDVFLLVSSREALSVAGEHAYPVPLLDVPPRSKILTAAQAMRYSAVQLFVERAAAALGRFSLTDETASVVAEICRTLDGIPLALELAAPRLKMLKPEGLLARLDDKLRILTSRRRTAMPRQQTLRAAIEWSYALLPEAERAILCRLGAFAGSFTLEAAAAVAAGAPAEQSDVFDALAGLVDKSLVMSLADVGENRYRLLESTRAFALEKLGANRHESLARRLCEYMTIVFAEAERSWPTTPRADWLPAYEPDLDNLRAALGWSLRPDGAHVLGVNLVSHTDRLWRELGWLQERKRWFELALSFVDDATPPSVEARIRLGLGWHLYGGYREYLSHNLRAIELMRQVRDEPALLGQGLAQAGSSTARFGDVTEAEQYYEEAVSVLRQCGRTKLLAEVLLWAGIASRNVGDLRAAQARVEEALALCKALGAVGAQNHCETQLAAIEFTAGQTRDAIDRATRVVETSHQNGTHSAEFAALHALAGFLVLDDQFAAGRTVALRAFGLSRALGNVGFHSSIDLLALVLAAQGEPDTAARLAGFSEGYASRRQIGRAVGDTAIRCRLIELLHSAMGPEACQTAMAAGVAWSEEEAVAAAEAV